MLTISPLSYIPLDVKLTCTDRTSVASTVVFKTSLETLKQNKREPVEPRCFDAIKRNTNCREIPDISEIVNQRCFHASLSTPSTKTPTLLTFYLEHLSSRTSVNPSQIILRRTVIHDVSLMQIWRPKVNIDSLCSVGIIPRIIRNIHGYVGLLHLFTYFVLKF